MIAFILVLALCASVRATTPDNRVIEVYIDQERAIPTIVLVTAQKQASEMFAAAAVRVHWHLAGTRKPAKRALDCLPGADRRINVVIEPAGRGSEPHPMAFSYPYDTVGRVVIFYDHVDGADGQDPRHTSIVLAHVLVHEITHVLQHADRHAESGIMKARWTPADFLEMKKRPLAFTPADIELIRSGLATGSPKRCAATR